MATVKIPDEGKTVSGFEPVRRCLAEVGIAYQRWEPSHPVPSDAPAEDVLAAYGREIDRLKAEGGYVTADVIDVKPTTPGLEGMLAKFRSEHWHDEDEVRFIIEGRGIFHIHPQDRPVLAIEVEAGPHPRAARDVALVRPLRGPPHPGHPPVPGSLRLDAALHRQRRRPRLRAGVLRRRLPAPPARRELTCRIRRAPGASAPFSSTSRGRRPRWTS